MLRDKKTPKPIQATSLKYVCVCVCCTRVHYSREGHSTCVFQITGLSPCGLPLEKLVPHRIYCTSNGTLVLHYTKRTTEVGTSRREYEWRESFNHANQMNSKCTHPNTRKHKHACLTMGQSQSTQWLEWLNFSDRLKTVRGGDLT